MCCGEGDPKDCGVICVCVCESFLKVYVTPFKALLQLSSDTYHTREVRRNLRTRLGSLVLRFSPTLQSHDQKGRSLGMRLVLLFSGRPLTCRMVGRSMLSQTSNLVMEGPASFDSV